MADAVSSVLGVEIVPQAVENAKEKERKSGITNQEFLGGQEAKDAKNWKNEN